MIFNNLRDKIPKKFVAFILALMLVVLSPFVNLFSIEVSAYTATINKWVSNGYEIARWETVPNRMYIKHISGNTNFSSGMAYAVQEWNDALDIGMGIGTTNLDDTAYYIQYYHGSREELISLNTDIADDLVGAVGVTHCDQYAYIDQWMYMGITEMAGHRVYWVRGYIVNYGGSSSQYRDAYRNVCTHELGHALGWRGHSGNANHVMSTTENPNNTVLQPDEITHLKQIYDFDL